MQWRHDIDYFAASAQDQMAEYCIRLYGDEQLWERFRANSLARVGSELSPEAFAANLHFILSEATAASAVRKQRAEGFTSPLASPRN
jgi:hypothetical protein